MRRQSLVADMALLEKYFRGKIFLEKLLASSAICCDGSILAFLHSVTYTSVSGHRAEVSCLALCGRANATDFLTMLADHLFYSSCQLEDDCSRRDGYLELFDALAADDKRLIANPGLHSAVTQEEIDFCLQFMLKHVPQLDSSGD